MDFFRSVFADDPDPPSFVSKPESSTSSHSQTQEPNSPDSDPESSNSNPPNPSSAAAAAGGGGGWSFGVLMKTLSTKSESVIETYRRDLQEFGSGLKKETQVLREVASRAVKDLPTSIEVGASKAQGSFESVGQAIDSIGSTVWKSTAEIIAQGKESLLAVDLDSDSSDTYNINSSNNLNVQTVNSARYSRFDAQLRAIQCDLNTYIEEPEDLDDYGKWKLGFDLEEKREEIEGLMNENGNMEGIYKRVVPNSVEHEVFWCRYCYRVHRLKQADSVRANLVKRAISREDEEEELSWDVDDDEEEEKANRSAPTAANLPPKGENSENKEVDDKGSLKNVEEPPAESSVGDHNKKEEGTLNGEGEKVSSVVESASQQEVSNEKVSSEGSSELNNDKIPVEKVTSEGKIEARELGKESNTSVISNHPSPEEEDLGWDEIEDFGSGDEEKVSNSENPNRVELRKQLSTAEEEEDLSWDIEDDDEPVKA